MYHDFHPRLSNWVKMFHNQYIQGNGDPESADFQDPALNPHVLDFPFNPSNSHAAQYPYPFNTAQQSGLGHLTCESIGGEPLIPQNFQDISNVLSATPGTVPLGTPGNWRHYPTNNWGRSPQGFMNSDNAQLAVGLSNSSQGLLGFPANDFIAQAPTPRQTAAPALPPASESNRPRPGNTKLDDRASFADFSHPKKTPGLREPKGYKVEKTRRPARHDKKSVVPSNPKAPQTAPTSMPGQQNPDSMTICSFYLWMAKRPGVMPTEHEMLYFSLLFGDSFETVRNWFLRNLATDQQDDDTGYQTMTSSNVDIDVAAAYRRRRSHCNRKADKLRGEDTDYVEIEWDEARPYACTSRCGKKFGKKAGWKRHEEMNHPPKAWLCHFPGCQDERKRVYFRRDKFGKHLRKTHRALNVTKTVIDSCCVPIRSNFSKYCLFYHCDKQFKTWKKRIDHVGDHLKNDRWDVSQWRWADDEIEESGDPDGSDCEDSEDSDSADDDDESEDSDADNGLGRLNRERESGSDPHDRGSGSSGGQRGQGSQRRSNGGATNDLNGYQLSLSNHSPDPRITESVPACCNQTVLAIPNKDALLLGTTSASYARSTFTDGNSTRPRPLLEVVLGPLGRGSKASVDEVKVQGYNGTVARKVIRHTSSRKQWELYREAKIMARFNHPHITHLIADYEDADSVTLLVLPVADCNLLQYLSGCPSGLSTGEEMWDWFNCLSSGLHYMHEKGVRHRDIKPSNILVKNKRLLYSDFGSSNLVADEESIGSESADFTEQYAAPEVYRGERGRAADVWSLGCVFYEIVTNLLRQPVEDLRPTKLPRRNSTTSPAVASLNWQRAREGNRALRLEAAKASASPYISFVLDSCEAMMRLQPEQRPTAAEISEKFAPCRCCKKEIKTGLEKDQQSGHLPGHHEANTARDGSCVPQLMPALVNSSEASTLSDASSIQTASFEYEDIPKYRRDPWSGHGKSALRIARVDTYSIPLDLEAPCEKMIQRYLREDEPLKKFLVLGESRYVSRSDGKRQKIGKAVEVKDCWIVGEDTLGHDFDQHFLHGQATAASARWSLKPRVGCNVGLKG